MFARLQTYGFVLLLQPGKQYNIMAIIITDRGSILEVAKNSSSQTFNKRDLLTTFNDPYLELTYKSQSVFKISDHNEVEEPASTSMLDLRDQLIDLTSTGGTTIITNPGGTEDYPLA